MHAGGLWLPESPMWLVLRERYSDALTNLKRVRGAGDEDAVNELQHMRSQPMVHHCDT
jgi:hypothetical protein